MNRPWLRHMLLIVVIIVVTAAAILGVKSFVEVLLYGQPMLLRIAKNSYAFVADVVVLMAAMPVCPGLKKIIPKL